jgi:hypothetical protein
MKPKVSLSSEKACLILSHFSPVQHMHPVGTDMRKKWGGEDLSKSFPPEKHILQMGLKLMTIW